MNQFFHIIVAGVVGAAAAGSIAYSIGAKGKADALADQKRKFASQLKTQSQSSGDKQAEQAGKLDRAKRLAAQTRGDLEKQVATLEDNLATRDTEIKALQARVPSPQSIIKTLTQLDPNRGSQVKTMRQVIHHLVALRSHGTDALPHIATFLETSQDIDYGQSSRAQNRNQPTGEGENIDWSSLGEYGYQLPRLGLDLRPRSLRLALFETTRDIGDKKAVEVLLQALNKTGLGLEVVLLGDLLDELEPNEHENTVLAIARDLIKNPLDEDSKRILFALLREHKDPGLLELAKSMLVSSEGRIDGAALRYLNETLGENAMPLLLAAYRNASVTNPADKLILRDAAMTYVGKNASADQIFRDVFSEGLKKARDPKANPREAWGSLFQAGGALLKGDNLDVNTLRNRQTLLNEFRGKTENPMIENGLNSVNKILETRIERADGSPQF